MVRSSGSDEEALRVARTVPDAKCPTNWCAGGSRVAVYLPPPVAARLPWAAAAVGPVAPGWRMVSGGYLNRRRRHYLFLAAGLPPPIDWDSIELSGLPQSTDE